MRDIKLSLQIIQYTILFNYYIYHTHVFIISRNKYNFFCHTHVRISIECECHCEKLVETMELYIRDILYKSYFALIFISRVFLNACSPWDNHAFSLSIKNRAEWVMTIQRVRIKIHFLRPSVTRMSNLTTRIVARINLPVLT